MAEITDLIKQVASEALGNNSSSLADNMKDQVLNGITDSILGSVKQTAQTKNGLQMLTSLVAGNGDASAATSQLSSLAGQIFTSSVANKLGLSSSTTNTIVSVLPTIIGALVSSKGKLDLSSLLSLAGVSSKSGLAGAIGGLLGKFFSK
jgi:hypothetical protein